MSLLGSLIVSILGSTTGLDEAIRDAEQSVDRFGKSMGDVGKSMSLLVTAPLVGLGALAIKSSIEFESAFAGVRKTVDATEEELQGFRKGILDMSKEIPAAATEIAAVAEAAGQLGIKNEAILGFTRTMVDLGVATNLSSDEAATALARLANITQMPQENFDRLGSTIVALGNNLATTEADIVAMGLRLAGAGNQVGLTEDQILSFAGALSSVGIEAEAGGSAVSRVMIDMAQAAATGGKAVGGFAAVAGMSASQFQKAFQDDAAGALISFIEGLGHMSDAGENVFGVLDDLGLSEIRVRDALLRASGAGDLFRESLEIGSKAWEENNALSNEAAQRYATTESRLKILKNRFDDVIGTIGDALVPVMMEALDAMEPLLKLVSDAANWFANLDSSMQRTIIIIAGIAAAIGPVLVVIGTVISSFSALLPVLAAIVSPVGLIVAGIAALVAGLVYLYNTNETVRETLNATWEWLSATAGTVFNAIRDVVLAVFGEIQAFWDKWGAEITTFFTEVWAFVSDVFTAVFNTIKEIVMSIFGTIKAFWDKWGADIVAAFKIYLNTLKTFYSTIFEAIWTFIKFIFGEIKSFWDKWGDTILQAFKDVFKILEIVWSSVFDAIFTAIKFIFNAIKAFWDKWGDTITVVFKTVFAVVKDVFIGVWNAIKIVIETVIGVVSGIIKAFLAVLKGDWKGAWDAVKGVAESIWDGIKKLFSTVGSTMMQIGKDIMRGLMEGIKSMAGAVKDSVMDVATGIGDGFKNFFGIHSPSKLMAGYGENISEGVAQGVSYASWKAEQATADMGKKIKKEADKAAKAAIAAAKKQFEDSKTYIEARKQANEISATQELVLWEKLQEKYKVGTKERIAVDKEVNRLRKELDKEAYETSKSYIDAKKQANQLSLTAELTAWERVQSRYLAGSKEREDAEKNVMRVRQEIYNELIAANENYLSRTKEINENVEAEEKRLNEEYAKAVDDRAKSISSFAGLFDEVVMKADKSGQDLLNNLRGQVSYLAEWSSNIEQLAAKGIDKGLLEELRQMGPKAAPELAALNQLTNTELQEYQSLWLTKTSQARSVATKELEGLKQDTSIKISELHKDAAAKLEIVRLEFETKIKAIRGNATNEFSAMKASMPEIGKQAIKGLMNGLENMKGPLVAQAKSIADAVSGTIRKALDIRSPSRVMMGLGEYIAEGLAKGIEMQTGIVEQAAQGMADAAAISVSLPEVGEVNKRLSAPSSANIMDQFTAGESLSNGMDVASTRPIVIQLIADSRILAETVAGPLAALTRSAERGLGMT
ncbi:phage tail tape measure protein [Cohnella herbarum]|uniref:Phage tail tape measure protein n=1 Tax=Cohnella herbarum TaxID=2728023 RepID=A0A7Z2ZQ67_9BACL|nr:phage tail tape measure protein [Cohnella herbarum]QJD87904.1 phage tail tape measure protein [Cohnella herbarum]